MSPAPFFRLELAPLHAPKPSGASAGGARSRRGDRRWGLADLVGELTRARGHIPHVPEPLAPELLYGEEPAAFLSGVEATAAGCRDALGRRLRRDALVAGIAVASFPFPEEQVRRDPRLRAMQERWTPLHLAFGHAEWGTRFAFLVAHRDERHLNLHLGLRAEAVPDLTRGGAPRLRLPVEDLDPLRAAAARVMAAGGSPREAGAAARAAGRALQARYWEAVGRPLGFAPPGTAGAVRLSRTGWRVRKAVEAAVAPLEDSVAEARRARREAEDEAERARRSLEATAAIVRARDAEVASLGLSLAEAEERLAREGAARAETAAELADARAAADRAAEAKAADPGLARERDRAQADAAAWRSAAARATASAQAAEEARRRLAEERDAARQEAVRTAGLLEGSEAAVRHDEERRAAAAAAREAVTSWATGLDASGAAAVGAALGHLRAADEGRQPAPLPRPATVPVTAAGADTARVRTLPEARAVEAGLAAVGAALAAVEEAAPGWRDRVLAGAARAGTPPAAAAAGMAAEFDDARRGRPPLDGALRALDARLAELELPAHRLARAVAAAPRVDGDALAALVRRRGLLAEELAWLPPPPAGAGGGRHRRLATLLHPRLLLAAAPAAAADLPMDHHADGGTAPRDRQPPRPGLAATPAGRSGPAASIRAGR